MVDRLSARLVMLVAVAALGPAACDGTPGGPLPVTTARSSKLRVDMPAVPAADAAALADGNADFALALYGALQAQPGNLVVSPVSLSLALGMTYAGARGETASQMAGTLRFSLPPERLHPAFDALALALAPRVTLANELWADQTQKLLPAFLDTLAQSYGAGVRLVDFVHAPEPARATINEWVATETAGKIADLLPAGIITPMVRLVLTNAVYLNASWQAPFTEPTMSYPFHRADGSDVSVPMMLGKHGFAGASGTGFRAVELPYADGALSMLVIVPDAGTFDAFESTMNAPMLTAIVNLLGPSTDGLLLPKFSFSLAVSLRDTLSAMGMPAAFDPSVADLSGMDGARDLFVQDVVEKASITVAEQGTEAAAASGVVVSTRSAVTLFAVDRPFLFVIRDRPTGALLFMGRVLDPAP